MHSPLVTDIPAERQAEAERMEQYAEVANRGFSDAPMFYVACIGVRPAAQGNGYAKLLLEAAHARAGAHPTATGVGLDTENPDNVALYQHLGFRQLGRAQVAPGLTVWRMFRPVREA